MKRGRIAVLIPARDGAAYVGECLESVLGQTRGDLRVVVSDDASSDGTVEVCRSYAAGDGRVEVLTATARRGWVGNTNALLDHVTEERFVVVAQDDVIAPAYLDTLDGALTGDAVCAFGDVVGFGERTPVTVHEPWGAARHERVISFLSGTPNGVALRGLTRRAVLDRGLRLRPGPFGAFHADTTYVMELLALGPVVRVPLPLYRKRYHPLSVMAATWDALQGDGAVDAWVSHTVTTMMATSALGLSRRRRRAAIAACLDRLVRALQFARGDAGHAWRIEGLKVAVAAALPLVGGGGARSAQARLDLAVSHRLVALGDASGARSHAERAIAADPDYAEARTALAGLLWSAGDQEAAKFHADQARRLAPWNPWVRLGVAGVLEGMGDLAAAETEALAAARLIPHATGPYLLLTRLAERRGDRAAAQRWLGSALEYDRDNAEVQRRRDEWTAAGTAIPTAGAP